MELLEKNYLNTTTMASVSSNTLLVQNIMTRKLSQQYWTDGFDDDSLTASLTITFDETLPVSRIAIMGINLKEFDIFYDGDTANTFAIPSGTTSTSTFNANSETSMFLSVTEVNCTSVTIDMKKTMLANSEKAIGYLYIGNQLLDFEKIPSASQYSPKVNSDEVVHRMSDGGVKINVKDRKRSADIKLKYVTREFKESLESVYDTIDDFVYVAFPTMTAWDEMMFPCVWEGAFEFEKYSDNNPSAGFEGILKLRETPT